MITIMRTKTFLNAIDDAYAKGASAGANAEALKNKEDQNRRMHDMYRYGKRDGYEEARYEIGEIDFDDLEDLDPSIFEEVES